MAKKSARKNRSARERMQQEYLAKKRKEYIDAELTKELKFILGCLVVASVLLAVVLIFA